MQVFQLHALPLPLALVGVDFQLADLRDQALKAVVGLLQLQDFAAAQVDGPGALVQRGQVIGKALDGAQYPALKEQRARAEIPHHDQRQQHGENLGQRDLAIGPVAVQHGIHANFPAQKHAAIGAVRARAAPQERAPFRVGERHIAFRPQV